MSRLVSTPTASVDPGRRPLGFVGSLAQAIAEALGITVDQVQKWR
jgi:hypothetical protein